MFKYNSALDLEDYYYRVLLYSCSQDLRSTFTENICRSLIESGNQNLVLVWNPQILEL